MINKAPHPFHRHRHSALCVRTRVMCAYIARVRGRVKCLTYRSQHIFALDARGFALLADIRCDVCSRLSDKIPNPSPNVAGWLAGHFSHCGIPSSAPSLADTYDRSHHRDHNICLTSCSRARHAASCVTRTREYTRTQCMRTHTLSRAPLTSCGKKTHARSGPVRSSDQCRTRDDGPAGGSLHAIHHTRVFIYRLKCDIVSAIYKCNVKCARALLASSAYCL